MTEWGRLGAIDASSAFGVLDAINEPLDSDGVETLAHKGDPVPSAPPLQYLARLQEDLRSAAT